MNRKKILVCFGIVLLFSPISAGTDIVEAAKNGNLPLVREILAKDPSAIQATDDRQYTALHWALIRANWEVAEFLIKNGADLNAVGGDGGTPLNWAVHHDNVTIVKLMIDQGAAINIQNQWGMTELHTAIWRGCGKVVDYLLEQGSDPMIRTQEGWTAMHYAYRSGHDHVIRLLREKGLSLRVQDNNGRYPRHLYFKKPNPVKLSDQELDDYLGKYYIGEYLMLEIWREGHQLKVMEFGPDEIYPVARDFFYFRQAPWTLIFSRDNEGKIDHAQLSFIRRSYRITRK